MIDKNGNEILGSFKFGALVSKNLKILLWFECILFLILFVLMNIYVIFLVENIEDKTNMFLTSFVWLCGSIFFYYVIKKHRKNELLIKNCLNDSIVLYGTTSVIKRDWNNYVKIRLEYQYLQEKISIESKLIRINSEILNANICFLYSKASNEIVFISQKNSNIYELF